MVKISPSILAADFVNLEREIGRITGGADYLHVDVMDGAFVPNITIGMPVVSAIRRCTDIPLDVHLMIEKPARYIEAFAKAGADMLTVHLEADGPAGISDALKRMKKSHVKRGIALRPITSARAVIPYLEELELILVMTVEPGFGGQSFIESQLETIAEVRRHIDRYNPSCELAVDGGIARDTIGRAFAAGANVFAAGSAIFKEESPLDAIEALRAEAKRAC